MSNLTVMTLVWIFSSSIGFLMTGKLFVFCYMTLITVYTVSMVELAKFFNF